MCSLRALAEKDLGVTLEGPDWGAPVKLISPDGVAYTQTVDGRPLRGQMLYSIVRVDPDSGMDVTIDTPCVSLRRSSLSRVPLAGETWLVEAPAGPQDDAPTKQWIFSSVQPPGGGASIGYIRLYLQEAEQTPQEPDDEVPE